MSVSTQQRNNIINNLNLKTMSTIIKGKLYKVEIKIGNDIITFDWCAENYKALMLANERIHTYGDEYKDTRYHSLHKRIIDLIMEKEPSLDKVMLEAALAFKLEVLSIHCGNGKFMATWDIGEAIERPIASKPYIAVRTDSDFIDKKDCLVLEYEYKDNNTGLYDDHFVKFYGVPDVPDHIFMAETSWADGSYTKEFELPDNKFYTLQEAQKIVESALKSKGEALRKEKEIREGFFKCVADNGYSVEVNEEGNLIIGKDGISVEVPYSEQDEDEEED